MFLDLLFMLTLLIISYLYKVRIETCWILFKSSLWNYYYPKKLDLFRISYKNNEVKNSMKKITCYHFWHTFSI